MLIQGIDDAQRRPAILAVDLLDPDRLGELGTLKIELQRVQYYCRVVVQSMTLR